MRGVRRCRGHDRVGRRRHLGTQPLLQHGVLDQDGLLEVAQLLAGVEAELVGQHPADVAQGGQRLGLAPRPGEREGVQRPDALLQRVPGGGLLGGGHDDGVVAERQQTEDAVLLGAAPQLVERRAFERDLGMVGQVGVGVTGPQGEQLLERVDVVGDRRRGRASRARGRS